MRADKNLDSVNFATNLFAILFRARVRVYELTRAPAKTGGIIRFSLIVYSVFHTPEGKKVCFETKGTTKIC